MKIMKNKKGFTLVECIVAMAVLAIMTLLLSMLLSISLNQRNNNMVLERQIDDEVDKLVSSNDSVKGKTNYKSNIEFKVDDAESPFDKIDSNALNSSDKLYIKNDDEIKLGSVKYDYKEEYFKNKVKDGLDHDNNDFIDTNTDSERIICAFDGTSGISDITIKEVTGKSSYVGSIYTVYWSVDFSLKKCSPEKAVKITLPSGANYIGVDLMGINMNLKNCKIYQNEENQIRLQPCSVSPTSWNGVIYYNGANENYDEDGDLEVHAEFGFTIPQDMYESYDSLKYFIFQNENEKGKNLNQAIIKVKS